MSRSSHLCCIGSTMLNMAALRLLLKIKWSSYSFQLATKGGTLAADRSWVWVNMSQSPQYYINVGCIPHNWMCSHYLFHECRDRAFCDIGGRLRQWTSTAETLQPGGWYFCVPGSRRSMHISARLPVATNVKCRLFMLRSTSCIKHNFMDKKIFQI